MMQSSQTVPFTANLGIFLCPEGVLAVHEVPLQGEGVARVCVPIGQVRLEASPSPAHITSHRVSVFAAGRAELARLAL